MMVWFHFGCLVCLCIMYWFCINWMLAFWRWQQYIISKRWCLPTSPHDITTQKTDGHLHSHENLRSLIIQYWLRWKVNCDENLKVLWRKWACHISSCPGTCLQWQKIYESASWCSLQGSRLLQQISVFLLSQLVKGDMDGAYIWLC